VARVALTAAGAATMSDAYPTLLDNAAISATWRAAWSEPHRHDHDQRDLRDCLALWMRWRDHSRRPGEVAIALWFHDADYDPQARHAGSNELNSAAWAGPLAGARRRPQRGGAAHSRPSEAARALLEDQVRINLAAALTFTSRRLAQ
jgi:hypothetical protein